MPKSIPQRDAGLIITRLWLQMQRLNALSMVSGEPFATRCVDGLLVSAVFVGQAEGRPMKAGKISTFAGVPRPTAIRRLTALEREGFLHRDDAGEYRLVLERFASAENMAAMVAARRAILRAAAELSKLDT